MLEQLSDHIRRHTLCKTTDKILLAVSGGIDSMVMLRLMKEAGFKVAVAHCNFQLRGMDSSADEALVRRVCGALGVPVFVGVFDTAAYAASHRVSVQMAARDLRYSFFHQVLEAEGYDLIATAHHMNDVMESVLLNLVRGTGIDGVVGIAPRADRIIRPLLFATRAAIVDYAMTNHVEWRDDASNFSDDYHRNFLRNQVIPRLGELNPALERTFRDTHERLTGARAFAREWIREFRSSAVEVRDTKTQIDIRMISRSPAPPVLLWELVKDLGFNFDQCRQIITDPHQPGRLFFSPTHQLLIDRSAYIIERKQASHFSTIVVAKGERLVGEAPFMLSLEEVSAADFQLVKDPAIAQLDADLLKFPLVWRKWEAGDYFVPLGMRQEKKLSDFLIDLKIPFNSKADVTVLESGGEIVWVVGFRIHERYKITAETRRVLVVEEKYPSLKK